MDYSAANTQLWNGILQLAILCAMLLLAQILRRKLPFIRRTLMPTAVLAGFLTLALRYIGVLPIQRELMEIITYHALGLGFVALALRVPEPLSDEDKRNLTGLKSGALIASCYVSQAIVGLLISLGLAFTFMPGLFKASGLLLPMGFGQGPGQANNIGSSYQALGFAGGQSYGLAIAACGFLVACLCGVVYLNYLQRKGLIQRSDGNDLSEIVPLSTFQQENELPIAESVDRFSINIALVLVVYGATYLLSLGLTRLAGDGGLGNTVSSLVWGFNFLIGALLAILTRNVIKGLRKANFMHRQYQNNYLLSRASGAAFDVMIIAGIAAIDFNDLTGLWLPFVITAVAGGLWTFFYLRWICRRI
ncbi:MAG: sodium:glutamate symporter, partial [Firmicutes bacterium]|nr:sodium:glutamate symporter [Bacillota bacterium]